MSKLEKLEQDVKDIQAVYDASEVLYANTEAAIDAVHDDAWDAALLLEDGDAYDMALDAAQAAVYDASDVAYAQYEAAYAQYDAAIEVATKALNEYLEGQANE